MKSSFITTLVIIPAFNVLCITLTSLAGWNPVIAIAPCVIGSFLFSFVGYNAAVGPYLEELENLKRELDKARKNDILRNEFLYSVSEAYKKPTEDIKVTVKDLKNLGIDKIAANQKPVEEEKRQSKMLERMNFLDDPFELRPKKDPERDKTQRIDPSKYSGEIVKKCLESLDGASEKVARLTDDIIIFSDVQTKKHVIQGGTVKLEPAIDKVTSVLELLASRKNVSMEIELEDGLTIEGVEERFVIMMRKILENAIIYSKKGGKVYITADKVNGYVFINVRDEGIGIPPHDINKIFDKFYRVPRENDPNPYGAGLGLTIVKHLADIMDAEIKVKSGVNQGTTVSVIFKRGLN